jgi:hypothetical protein
MTAGSSPIHKQSLNIPVGRIRTLPNKIKMLIEHMCRKTPYTGDGQSKIFTEASCAFICAIIK